MFLIIFLLLKSAVSVTITKEVYYRLWDNNMIFQDVISIGTESVASQLHCAVICTMHDLCIGANFHKDTQTCQIYKMECVGKKDDFVKLDNNFKAMIVKGLSVVHYEKTWRNHGALDCYVGKSHDYTGCVSKSLTDITCQSWNVNNPWWVAEKPVNSMDQETNYCRASENDGYIWCYTTSTNSFYKWEYCRVVPCFACNVFDELQAKPANTTIRFSVTRSPLVVFECESFDQDTPESHCPVSVCNGTNQWSTNYSVSCSNKDYYTSGSPYTGKMSCTNSGIPCQYWNSTTPHIPHYTPTGDEFHTNYCHSVGDNKPWCYTIDPEYRWDYCPVVER